MKITLNITEDHIKLIKAFNFQQFNENQYGVDSYQLFFDDDVYKSVALLLDKHSDVIPESIESPLGCQYKPETQEYLDMLVGDMNEHLVDYEDILHQFCDKGGLKPGKYSCIDNVRIWEYNKE